MLSLTYNSLYQAMELFESNKITDSIPLFIQSLLEGNLFAVPYLNYLIENNHYSNNELDKKLKENNEVYDFKEFYNNTPHRGFLEDTLKASIIIQKLFNKNNLTKNKSNALCEQLFSLTDNAHNASIFFMKSTHIKYAINYKKLLDNINSNFSFVLYTAIDFFSQDNIELNKQILNNKPIQEKILVIKKLLLNSNYNQTGIIEYKLASVMKISEHDNFIKTSALMGNINAQGRVLDLSIDTYDNTLRWHFVRAFRGNVHSKLELAKKYCCLGSDEGNKKMIYWYKHALDSNDCSSLSEDEVKNSSYSLGLFLSVNNDYIEAERYYLRSAKAGSYESLNTLGNYNYYGYVRAKNYSLALSFYQKAIDIFEKSHDNKYDLEKEYGTYDKIVDMYDVGGYGIERNGSKALEILESLPQLNDNLKCIYGTYLFDGYLYNGNQKNYIKKNIPLAIKNFKESADSSYSSALSLIEAYVKLKQDSLYPEIQKELEGSLSNYLTLAEGSDPELLNKYWIWYHFDVLELKEPKEAIRYIHEGVEKEYFTALLVYSSLLKDGFEKLNIQKNLESTLEHLKKAITIKKGTAWSIFIEGYILLSDELSNIVDDSKKDKSPRYVEARIKLLEAFDKKIISAAPSLSKIYEDGLGVEKCLNKAIQYLEEAKSLRDPGNYHNLARLYTKKEPKNLKLASENFELAVQKNHKESFYPSVQCIIQRLINEEISLDELSLDNLLLRLKPSLASQDKSVHKEIKATYWYGLLSLLNGAALDEIKKLYCQNNEVINCNPIKEFLKFVNTKKTISSVETLIFLTHRKPLDILSPLNLASNETLQEKKSTNSTSTLKLFNTNNKKDKIWHEIHSFNEYGNLKNVNIYSFKKMLSLIRKLNPEISFKVEPSKSSNQNFKIFIPNFETIAYSYHPRHKSGSSMDKQYDVKRARDLQDQVKQISNRIS